MTRQATLEPVYDEERLAALETQFLRGPAGFWALRTDGGPLPGEMLAPAAGGPLDDDESMWMTHYRTRSGCCG